jgi:hypothetical protein
MHRRDVVRSLAVMAAAPAIPGALEGAQRDAGADNRDDWIARLRRVADPVLANLARGTLRARMPVEQAAGADRAAVTHLEAFGRLFAGIAPFVETGEDTALADLVRASIARGVDPASPDFFNFTRNSQPLVDAAFLAQGLLRARRTIVDTLGAGTKERLIAALTSTRAITPGYNNWLLFTAMVEAGLAALGATPDLVRVDYALRQHDAWYKGDGAYGDGPVFHWDYYNSFVIQPMLVDVLEAFKDGPAAWKALATRVEERATRYAAIQERAIAPDGTFPPIGRSLAYRCGAFHLLAQSALRRALPDGVSPAQVRGALSAVLRRTLDAPGTFDAEGWLRIGFCGHQPGIGENYISTGSLYLCAVAFLPLGLTAADRFWSAPPEPWTQQRAWSGQPFAIDHALAT